MRKIALSILLGVICSSPLYASGNAIDVTVIKAGQILDVKTGKLVKNKYIIVDGERIRAIATLKDMEEMEDELSLIHI